MTASNIYGRQVIVPLTNKSGGAVVAGDVVILDSANDESFTTTTSGGYTGGVGIAQQSIANNAVGLVLTMGYAALVNVAASVTRGNYGKTHTVAKQATSTASRGTGTFCFFMTGGTTPTAYLFPVDLLGSSLTNPMTTQGDIIYSSDGSGTPARLAAGAAGKFLTAAGAGSNPAWGQGPLTTDGDLLLGATAGTPTRLAVGANGKALIVVSGAPAYKYPPGYEFDYVQITAAVTITGTADSSPTTCITGSAVSYDGSTAVYLEVYIPFLQCPATAGSNVVVQFNEGSTILGYCASNKNSGTSAAQNIEVLARRKITPSNASHTYHVKAWMAAGANGTFGAGNGSSDYLPAYFRIVAA